MSTEPRPAQLRTTDLALRLDGVVVGFDGTWHSRPAVDRAALEAVERGLALTVLTVVPTATQPGLRVHAQQVDVVTRWERATQEATAAIQRVRTTHPELSVALSVVMDTEMSHVRLELAAARLIVLGDTGRVGPRAFLLGSTSRTLVRATRCPILVVPAGERASLQTPSALDRDKGMPPGVVLVGVGRGPAVPGLLRVAADEARRRGCRLHVLHSYVGAADEGAVHPAEVRAHLQRKVCEARLHPSVQVTTVLTPEAPADALLRLSGSSGLLVIGSRGTIALARLALGSVSAAVLEATVRPVLVVPHAVAEAVPAPVCS